MKFCVKHRGKGRIRVSFDMPDMTIRQADLLLYYIYEIPGVVSAKVYERTADVVICYQEGAEPEDGNNAEMAVLHMLQKFSFAGAKEHVQVPEHTGRELTHFYQDKLCAKLLKRMCSKLIIPVQIRAFMTICRSVRYVKEGINALVHRRMEVSVLDGAAIGISVLRADWTTAGSVMFLLEIGELLEEWTHKKSVDDLARSMSLHVDKVWLAGEDQDELVPISAVKTGDCIRVHMGNMIPLDGTVLEGEALVNQAALTGEAIAVRKENASSVYAGTVLEEGELVICVQKTAGATRYEKIVSMIEASEKLKSGLESRAEHLADRLVPYNFMGTAAVFLLTGSLQKALTVLMVDFSCALKLSMPLAVLSAMRECSKHQITVKGGKFLEAIAQADTIVFDKTGTLTKAQPKVADIITFGGTDKTEMLRLSACLEEHFPHSMANAVVAAANEEGLLHEERHAKVEYIVAHGIATTVDDVRVIIGSAHFVFEDERCVIPEGDEERFEKLPGEYSHLYLAIGGRLAAVICVEDPLREEAGDVLAGLKRCGIKNMVMMTGDSERVARSIARQVGICEYHAQVLPEEKAGFIERLKKEGHHVIMIGDGINDSPALSMADVGIAVSEGAQVAREIADITISASRLDELITLKQISDELIKRIHGNYRFTIGFNLFLISMGVAGSITPGTSALLHNLSTIGIGLNSMTDLLK